MSFSRLRRRVERGEALLEGRIDQVGECHGRLRRDWRQAWTPLRIVLAGLATGFIAGRAEPEKVLKKIGSVSGPRTLQLVTSVAGLVGSVQAAIAAMTAKDAARTADDAAGHAAEVAGEADSGHADTGAQPEAAAVAGEDVANPAAAAGSGGRPGTGGAPRPDRRRPDQRWESQPSPAEAATELSER